MKTHRVVLQLSFAHIGGKKLPLWQARTTLANLLHNLEFSVSDVPQGSSYVVTAVKERRTLSPS